MPYFNGNLTTPRIHVENHTKKEPKTLQPKALASADSHLNSSLDLQNHSKNNKKKGEFEILDDSITSMKAELLEVKFFLWMKSLWSNRDLNTKHMQMWLQQRKRKHGSNDITKTNYDR